MLRELLDLFLLEPCICMRFSNSYLAFVIKLFKGAEATCVEIATEMKICFRLKDMLSFNVL